MGGPKLTRIVDAIIARASDISVANGYYTDCGLNIHDDRRQPQESEAPILVVSVGERVAEDTQTKRSRCNQSITLTGFVIYNGTDAIGQAVGIISDIQRAVELEDETLGGLLQGSVYGLSFVSDELFLPDAGETVVGGRVTYAVPHIRKSGDPEII